MHRVGNEATVKGWMVVSAVVSSLCDLLSYE